MRLSNSFIGIPPFKSNAVTRAGTEVSVFLARLELSELILMHLFQQLFFRNFSCVSGLLPALSWSGLLSEFRQLESRRHHIVTRPRLSRIESLFGLSRLAEHLLRWANPQHLVPIWIVGSWPDIFHGLLVHLRSCLIACCLAEHRTPSFVCSQLRKGWASHWWAILCWSWIILGIVRGLPFAMAKGTQLSA